MKYLIMLLAVSMTIFSTGCKLKSEYQKMEERELAKGIRQDSLFLGLSLGMTMKDFYTHCWELNKQKIIEAGGGNATAKCKLSGLKYPASMEFYPNFTNDSISEMPTTIIYDGWAPWNKKLSSDSLIEDVKVYMEKQYGKGFIRVDHPKKGFVYVKVDGNRRILIKKKTDSFVEVNYSDLLVEKKKVNVKPKKNS